MVKNRRPARAQHSTSRPDYLAKHSGAIVLGLVLIGSIRIASTYKVFNHTFDEPIHLACGLEWLDKGVYRWEAQHPPLARVATALGPYLAGIRSPQLPKKNELSMTHEGLAALYQGSRYDLILALARLGILPFFWIACLVVYRWGKRFDPATAVVAVFFFSFLPPILAHASFATTDMALTALLGAAFLSGIVWLENPTRRTGAHFGALLGLMVLSKFSALVFFPASAALALGLYLFAERPTPAWFMGAVRQRAVTFGLAALTAILIVWAGYRFSFGKVDFANIRLPAPEFFRGIEEVRMHNELGHRSYLLGKLSGSGFWHFYPVALAVKTPIAFLLLLGWGAILSFRSWRREWRVLLPLAFSTGILLVGIFSRINIGIRHVLPVYFGFSLIAAWAAGRLWNKTQHLWIRYAVGILQLWFAGSSLAIHPDYLAYFNEAAGEHPENILVDSDLDWEQDIKRLSTRLRELGVQEVTFAHIMVLELEKQHGFPRLNRRMDVQYPNPGWTAVTMTLLKQRRLGLLENHPEVTPWPERYEPRERVGKGILLYYIPPGSIPAH